jgi:endonuclease/exonuclease/phosphatase family metal-dependent hydrolase
MVPIVDASCRSASLQWFAPDDQTDRERLDAWCAGVGLPVIDASALRTRLREPSAIPIDDLTFVSWNVHVGNGDIRAFVRDLQAGSLTSGRKVGHFALMLQEVLRTGGSPPLSGAASGARRIAARDSARNDIVEISRELGLSLIYAPSMRNGNSPDDPPDDRGSAILSTLPLSEPMAIELPGERQRRVVIVAKVLSLSVGVIHLDALGGFRRLALFWTPWMRELQARSLRALLPDGTLVLGADLNTWHGTAEPAVRVLERLSPTGAASFHRGGIGVRVLDYLFIRTTENRPVQFRQVNDAYGSDHRPLIGWIDPNP